MLTNLIFKNGNKLFSHCIGSYDPDGMPSVIKIKRKPKGVGCECKTLADAQSTIMVRLEINEGKTRMATKKWQSQLGAGTATTLRLTQPWHGTGRLVVGDSWFGSVKTAVQLHKQGLYFLGIVKTATKDFPMKAIKDRCPEDRGGTICAKATVENTDLLSVAWKDKKIHTFIGSCSTTLEGTPAKKRRTDDEGRPYIYQVPRIKLVEEYFSGAPAIDVHNHIRQSGLALELVWNTQNWKHRIYASLLGIIETNAYLAYKYFKNVHNNVSHSTFTEKVAHQLILYKENETRDARENGVGVGETVSGESTDHKLVALSSISEKTRVQRKCVICSRVHKKQQKASYFCGSCGYKAVLCSPTTGRDCFAYHVVKGIPNFR